VSQLWTEAKTANINVEKLPFYNNKYNKSFILHPQPLRCWN